MSHPGAPGSHSYFALACSNLVIIEMTANSLNTKFKPKLNAAPTQPQPDPQMLLVTSMLLHMKGCAEEGKLEEIAILTDG